MDYEKCKESADYIGQRAEMRPQLGVICGSGLAALAELMEECCEIPYADIPHFMVSTAPGHKSRLLFGKINGLQVVLMQGRFHLYEGYSIHQCAMHIRVLHLLGVKGLVITNAAGGLDSSLNVGDVMLLSDHISFMSFVGINPLCGANDQRFGPRFFALDQVYDLQWRKLAKELAQKMGLGSRIKEGVYTMLGGPNFETPAELRMLRASGVDAVGMSTVHEATTARHSGIRVLAFSLITNACVTNPPTPQEHGKVGGGDLAEEVFDVAKGAEPMLKNFVGQLLPLLESSLSEVA